MISYFTGYNSTQEIASTPSTVSSDTQYFYQDFNLKKNFIGMLLIYNVYSTLIQLYTYICITIWGCMCVYIYWLPGWLSGIKNPFANLTDTGDAGSIPGSGRSPGGGNGSSILAWKIP